MHDHYYSVESKIYSIRAQAWFNYPNNILFPSEGDKMLKFSNKGSLQFVLVKTRTNTQAIPEKQACVSRIFSSLQYGLRYK